MHREFQKLLMTAILFTWALTPHETLGSSGQNSWHEFKFRNMIPQELEVSCGAATIASLLNFYAGEKFTERQIIDLLTATVSKNQETKVLRLGFNLLQIKQALLPLGYSLRAARTYNDQLVRFASPALLQLKTKSGHHFVVWHGKVRGLHWLGDPSEGDKWISDLDLEKSWTGIAAWIYIGENPLSPPSPTQLNKAYRHR